MAFCRRCGDIVSGDRCAKCGGSAVAAAVRAWNPANATITSSETRGTLGKRFLSSSQSSSSTATPTNPRTSSHKPAVDSVDSVVDGANRFLSGRMRALSRDADAAPTPPAPTTPTKSATSSNRSPSISRMLSSPPSQPPRTPSPFKSLSSAVLNPDSPDPTIVLNMDKASGGSLAKVYGSVLQPTTDLASFVCSACDTPFPPDATIYPSLTNSKEFFCRPCFTENGGSRGACDACGREVLRLKAEGGFVENSGRVWHSKCFKCEGCGRDISTRPMVDVLGRPCCADCFDDCLNRGRGSARASRNPSPASKAVGMTSPVTTRGKSAGSRPESALSVSHSNPGGLRKSPSQPGLDAPNAVVEELARRIGAPSPSRKASRDSSPVLRSSPSRELKKDDAFTSSLNRSITDRLAALAVDSPPGSRSSPGSSSPPKRYPGLDFGTPSKGSTAPASPTSVDSPPRSPSKSPSRTPFATSQDQESEPSPAPPRSADRASLGLLTPGSTPTQSPMSTPPARPSTFTSTPGTGSRIPSLRGRHSITSITSPPPSTSSPGVNSPSGTPRRPSGATSRIPSVSSPKTSTGGHTPVKSTPFKSNLPTIASSPASSPASTIVVKTKPERPSLTALTRPSPDEKCNKCEGRLHSVGSSGRIVSVPSVDGERVEQYHAGCFCCEACGGTFAEVAGAASFVRFEGGVRHLECTPAKTVQTFKHPTHDSLPAKRDFSATSVTKDLSSGPAKANRLNGRPVSMYASPSAIPKPNFIPHQTTGSSIPRTTTLTTAPRFGSPNVCPGCQLGVSPMERGIVPGPSATKWHATCLVCGGKNNKRSSASWKIREEAKGPGCGKKLDSAAKGDPTEGVVWCRDCWEMTKVLSLGPISPSSATSPSLANAPSIFPSSRPSSSLGLNTSARPLSRSGTTSPVRRPLNFPRPTTPAAISEDNAMMEFDDSSAATPYLGGRISPLKQHYTGAAGNRSASPLRPQYTGAGLRSTSPVRRQYTGATTGAGGEAPEAEPIAIQYTGGGVPVTRTLSTRHGRPKSALGTRSFGSQKSIDEGRGMYLVRQMTGHGAATEEE